MQTLSVKSVNVSTEKGTIKTPVEEIILDETGVAGDAHSGNWHRQISLLGVESIYKASEMANIEFKWGVFAENITTEGLELFSMKPSDKLICNDIIIEITQIGKTCHKGCEIMQKVGNCVMPTEGIFARVIHGGKLKAGDIFTYQPALKL